MSETLVWPSYRYRKHPETGHPDKRVFNSHSELLNAGEGWHRSPADIPSQKPSSPVLEAPAAPGEPAIVEPCANVANSPSEIDFSGLDDAALREIAAKAGVKVDKRWGRARLEAELKGA